MTDPQEVEGAPPALFEHCCRTYKEMLRQAKAVVQPTYGDEQSAGQIIVYEGFFTQLVTNSLNLSVPYYTNIRQALLRMGCIKQLKRGGGTSPSQWELIYEPTLEAFYNARPSKIPKQTKDDAVQQQILDLSNRVNTLNDQVDGLIEALDEYFGSEPKLETSGEVVE